LPPGLQGEDIYPDLRHGRKWAFKLEDCDGQNGSELRWPRSFRWMPDIAMDLDLGAELKKIYDNQNQRQHMLVSR
jgi:hypothetical protein